MDISKGWKQPLRVLSLDGGGPGSISQLRIIGEYMTRLAHDLKLSEEVALTARYFDLIGGSGFGGYIALLLGRLGMTVEEATDELIDLALILFPNGRLADTKPEANMERLRGGIKDMLQRHSLPVDLKLKDEHRPSGTQCKVVLLVSPSVNVGSCQFFRTYSSRQQNLNELTFLDAACATLAIPELFTPALVSSLSEKKSFTSASFGYNNPTREILGEVEREFGLDTSSLSLVLSVGSGRPCVISLQSSSSSSLSSAAAAAADDYDSVLSRVMTDCENVERELSKRPFGSGKYLRLNVNRGMEHIKMSDWTNLGGIESLTNVYLDDHAITKAIDSSLSLLALRPTEVQNYSGFECPICTESLESYEVAVRLESCGHVVCRDCMKLLINTQLQYRQVPMLCAPCTAAKSKTPGVITRDIVGLAGGKDALRRLDELLIEKVQEKCVM